jgi:hypothetical protein
MPADPTPGQYYQIASKATGRRLSMARRGDSAAGTLHVVPHDRGLLWLVERADIGLRFSPRPWTVTSVGGTSVHWESPLRLDSNFERQVYFEPANQGDFQKWRPIPDGEGYWRLVNVATGFALDGTDRDIYTRSPNDGAFQRRAFLPEATAGEHEGFDTYHF